MAGVDLDRWRWSSTSSIGRRRRILLFYILYFFSWNFDISISVCCFKASCSLIRWFWKTPSSLRFFDSPRTADITLSSIFPFLHGNFFLCQLFISCTTSSSLSSSFDLWIKLDTTTWGFLSPPLCLWDSFRILAFILSYSSSSAN